jgi:glycerophosphoryl diester phosphodiesterase
VNLLRGDGRPLYVGHRGAAALAPDNTLEGLAGAIELGCDLVEFDVLAHDGRLVLSHSLEELAERPATLDEALALLVSSSTGPHVDLKERGIAEPLADALRRHGLVERTIVSSADAVALRELGLVEPRVALGLTYPRDRYGVSRRRAVAPLIPTGVAALRRALPYRIVRMLEGVGARTAVLHYAVVTKAALDRCHAAGAAVLAWTVNEPALARTLEDLGIDGIISDDPRIVRAEM